MIQTKILKIVGGPKLVRPLLLLPMLAVVTFCFYDKFRGTVSDYLLVSFLWLVLALITWEARCRWTSRMRLRFPRVPENRKRIFITFSGYVLIELVSQFIGFMILLALGFGWMEFVLRPYLTYLFLALITIFAVSAAYEILHTLEQYRITLQESEAAKNQVLQNQFNSLKNQVNPHFLFNSLNSLSALIAEDRPKAGAFLDELSSVYRYLLQSNENGMVSLRNECDFINSYLFLLKTRYATALEVAVAVGEEYADMLLPQQTLQILVENAIRHNVIMSQKPLRITIVTSGGYLAVSNSIQYKNHIAAPAKTGLKETIDRFKELNLGNLMITDDGQLFTVKVPLLSKRNP